jgi:hypothetical protein
MRAPSNTGLRGLFTITQAQRQLLRIGLIENTDVPATGFEAFGVDRNAIGKCGAGDRPGVVLAADADTVFVPRESKATILLQVAAFIVRI